MSSQPAMEPLTSWLGRRVEAGTGRGAGAIRDLVVDLAEGHGVVTEVVVGRRRSTWRLRWADLERSGDQLHLRARGAATQEPGTGSSVWLVRDVLDGRVYDVERRRTARVGEVWLEQHADELEVVGLELGARVALRRVGPSRGRRSGRPAPARLVPLTRVHLMSRRGHRAQLDAPGSAVHRLDPDDLAHLMTHLPTGAAVQVARTVASDNVDQAARRLHPRVAQRLDEALRPGPQHRRRPRLRRTDGWRVFPPRER